MESFLHFLNAALMFCISSEHIVGNSGGPGTVEDYSNTWPGQLYLLKDWHVTCIDPVNPGEYYWLDWYWQEYLIQCCMVNCDRIFYNKQRMWLQNNMHDILFYLPFKTTWNPWLYQYEIAELLQNRNKRMHVIVFVSVQGKIPVKHILYVCMDKSIYEVKRDCWQV